MNLLIVLAKIYHLVVCVSCVLYFRDISTDFHSKSTLKAPEKNPFNPSKNVLKKTQRLTDTTATDTNNDYSPFKKNQEKIQSKRQALVYVPFVENQAKYLENDLYKPEIFDAIHESAKKGLIKVLNNYPVEQTIMNEPREEYLNRMKEFSRKTKRSNSNQDSLNDTLLKLIGIASLYGSLAKRSPLTNRNHNISQSSLPNKLHPRSHTTNVSESEKIAPDMQTFMEILSRKKKAKQFLPVSKSQSSSFCKQNDSDTNDLEDEDTNSTITGTLDLLHMKIEVPKSAIDAKLLYLIKQFVEDPQVGSRVKISPEEIPQVHLKDVGSIPMEHLNELLQKLMTIKHVTKRSTDTRPIRMSLNDADVADLEKIVSFLNDIRFNKYGALFADDVPTSEVLLTVINKYKQQNEELREEIQNTHPIKVQKFFRMEAMTPGFREFSRHRTSTEPEPDDDIDDEQKQFSSGREYEERPKNSRVHKTHHPRPFGYFQNRYHSKTFAKTTPKSSQVSYENYEDEQEDELEPVEKESQGPSNNRLLRDFGESLHENLTANNKDNTPMPKTTSKSPDFEKLGWTDPAASKNQKTAPQGVDKLNPAEFLYRMNKKAEIMHHKESLAEWAYECDMSEKKNAALKKISLRLVKAERKISEKIRAYSQIYQGNNPLFLRQFKLWSILGESALPDDKYLKLQSIVANMTYIYSTATLCPYQSHSECTLKLEPDITNIMANGRDPHMLYYYWNAWREQTGRVMKPLFEEYVRLMNDVAHLNSKNFYKHDLI